MPDHVELADLRAYDVLCAADNLLSSPGLWGQANTVTVGNAYCVYTAIISAAHGTVGRIAEQTGVTDGSVRRQEIARLMQGAVYVVRSCLAVDEVADIFEWNDREGRTFEQVKALFHDAKNHAINYPGDV